MKRFHDRQMLGIGLMVLGIYWACKSLHIFEFSLFFPGWWTLFIIVPCGIELKRRKSVGGNLFGFLLGILLLLWRQGWITGSHIPTILFAAVLIIVGVGMMLGNNHTSQKNGNETKEANENPWYGQNVQETYSYTDQQPEEELQKGSEQSQNEFGHEYNDQQEEQNKENFQQEGTEKIYVTEQVDERAYTQNRYGTYETCPPNISAILVGKAVSCLDGIFRGTNVQCILGNVQLDLRQAKLERDVYVNVNMILGGMELYLPDDMQVVVETQSILGDVRNIRHSTQAIDRNSPAVHVSGTCILGGLEIK